MILFLFSERRHYAKFLAFAIIRCQLKKIQEIFKSWLFTYLFTWKRAGNLFLKEHGGFELELNLD